jgi:hypothetical protein
MLFIRRICSYLGQAQRRPAVLFFPALLSGLMRLSRLSRRILQWLVPLTVRMFHRLYGCERITSDAMVSRQQPLDIPSTIAARLPRESQFRISTPPSRRSVPVPTRFISSRGRTTAYVRLSALHSTLLAVAHRVAIHPAAARHLLQAARPMRFRPMPFHPLIWTARAVGQPNMTQAHLAHPRDPWCIRRALLHTMMPGSFT